MSYTKQTWADGEVGDTPLSASRLNYLEDGVAAALASADLPGELTDYAKSADVATDLAAKADLVSGTVPVGQLPTMAITDYLGGAADQTAMLALTGQKGDFCTRTDTGTNWVIAGDDPTQLTSWVELSGSSSPTWDSVQGKPATFSPTIGTTSTTAMAGNKTFSKSDVGLANVDNTADASKPVSTAMQTALDAKVPTTRTINGTPLTTDITVTSTPVGYVALDSFSGANDDAKLDAAMSYAGAQTHPPTIKLSNQTYTFTGVRTPYTGFRLEGTGKIANSELSDVNMYTKLNVSGSPFWLNASTTVRNCYLGGFAALGNSTTSFIGGSGMWFGLCMRDVAFHSFKSVLGSQTQKMILSVCDFGGWWQIQGTYNGAVHIGGSDCRLWLGDYGCLVDGSQAYNTAGSAAGQYHFWFNFLDNTTVGPLYITATGLWGGIRVSGPDYNAPPPSNRGSVVLTGGCVEGHNAGDPGYGSMIRVDGGDLTIRDNYIGRCMSNPSAMGHSPQDAGYVHVEGGAVLLDGTKWDRYTGQSETVPVVYQSGGWVRAINSRVATLGGQWSGLPQVKTVGGIFYADDTHTKQA